MTDQPQQPYDSYVQQPPAQEPQAPAQVDQSRLFTPPPYNAGTISVIIISILIVIMTLFILKTANQAIKNEAVDKCFRIATSIKQGDYIRPIYVSCLTDMGYRQSDK